MRDRIYILDKRLIKNEFNRIGWETNYTGLIDRVCWFFCFGFSKKHFGAST